LGEITQAVATEMSIAAEVLATRRDLEQLARGELDGDVMSGWRREVLGERLRASI
jgi:ribonuclease D